MVFICRICENQNNQKIYHAKEMMFGFRDEFEYVECGACGCLQIVSIPQNLAKYYPPNYYSFQKPDPYIHKPVKIFFKKKLIKQEVYKQSNLLGQIFKKFYPEPEDFYEWFAYTKTPFTAQILDIGCGSGSLLLKLRKSGFVNVRGADPFISETIEYPGGVTVYKKSLTEISENFDLMIMNHSLEHMPDQIEIFKNVHRLLNPGGFAIIRIPVTGTYAWRTYGVNWVQLDAPRHLYLHTSKSMHVLAEKTGLQIKHVVFDSLDFQFWGSEQYLKDLPLRDPRSYAEDQGHSMFTSEQIEAFRKKAAELNSQSDGDAATFYVYKPQ